MPVRIEHDHIAGYDILGCRYEGWHGRVILGPDVNQCLDDIDNIARQMADNMRREMLDAVDTHRRQQAERSVNTVRGGDTYHTDYRGSTPDNTTMAHTSPRFTQSLSSRWMNMYPDTTYDTPPTKPKRVTTKQLLKQVRDDKETPNEGSTTRGDAIASSARRGLDYARGLLGQERSGSSTG